MLSKAKNIRYFLILRLELEFRSLLKCWARQWHFQQKAIFRLENDLIDTIHSFAILNLNGFEVGISRWQHCRWILIEWTDGLSGFEITKPILKYNFRKHFILRRKIWWFFSVTWATLKFHYWNRETIYYSSFTHLMQLKHCSWLLFFRRVSKSFIDQLCSRHLRLKTTRSYQF